MHWATKYIGKKPEQVNFCWGLLRLIYADFNVTLPSVEGLTRENAVQIADQVRGQMEGDWEEVPEPFELCVVAMGQSKEIHHVGVYTGADGGKIIHCWGSHCTIADDFRGLKFKGFRIIRFYRHKLWPT
jgi:cell wall-associated NlpC family hydrolase